MRPAHLVPHTWTCAFRTHGGACDCLDRIVIDPAGSACRPVATAAAWIASSQMFGGRNKGGDLMRRSDDVWSIRQVAAAAGTSPAATAAVLKEGLLPGYEPGPERRWAEITPDMAASLVQVLSARCYSTDFARLMKSDPHRALAAARELGELAATAVELAELNREAAA